MILQLSRNPDQRSCPRLRTVVSCLATVCALSLAALGAAPALARPDNVSVAATVDPATAYLGDSITLQVRVGGSRNPDQPDLSELTGFDVEFLGGQDVSHSSVMIINGRRSEDSFKGYVFQYRLTPTSKGVHTIPPIRLVVNGQPYQTEPIQVNVIEPGSVEGFKLRLTAEKSRLYAGEPVRVRLTWYIGQDVQRFSFSVPGAARGGGDYDLLPAPDPRPPGTREGDPRFITFDFLGQPAVASRARAELDGQVYETVTLDRILVPHKPGEGGGRIAVGPAHVAFDAVVGRRQRSVFDFAFDDVAKTERRVVASDPLNLEVLPLPEPAPPGFMGLIGEFTVEATAQPTEVNVGDPITLTVRVLGPEPLERVPPLALARQPGLADSFKLPREPTLPTVQPGAAVFTQIIRAGSDRVTEIPPIQVPYFDVASGAYGIAKSRPIPLTVHPTTEVTLEGDTQGVSKEQASGQRRGGAGGLAPIITSPAALGGRDAGFDLASALRGPIGIGAVAVPPGLYLLTAAAVFVHRRAARDPPSPARRRRRALARARSRLRAAAKVHPAVGRGADPRHTSASAVSAAVRGYIADVLALPEAGLTGTQGAAMLQKRGVPSAGDAEQLLGRCDAHLFAGGLAEQPGTLVDEARALLDRLAGELEGSR